MLLKGVTVNLYLLHINYVVQNMYWIYFCNFTRISQSENEKYAENYENELMYSSLQCSFMYIQTTVKTRAVYT